MSGDNDSVSSAPSVAILDMCHRMACCRDLQDALQSLVEKLETIPEIQGALAVELRDGTPVLHASFPANLQVSAADIPILEDRGEILESDSLEAGDLPSSIEAQGAVRLVAGSPGIPLNLLLWWDGPKGPTQAMLKEIHSSLFVSSLLSRVRDLEEDVTRLSRDVEIDALTQLKSRRFALAMLESELARADRGGQPLSLILLDIDHFKKFNDTYGHQLGDRVLREVGRVLSRTARHGDVVGRVGGEEFLIVLPDTSLENAQLFAERLRGAIERYGRRLSGLFPDLSLTISLGVAAAAVEVDALEDAVARADRALYASKRNGRNQVNVGLPPEYPSATERTTKDQHSPRSEGPR